MEMKMITAIKCIAEVCNQIGLPVFSTGYILPSLALGTALLWESLCLSAGELNLEVWGREGWKEARSSIFTALYKVSFIQTRNIGHHPPARGYSYWSSPQTPMKGNTGSLYLKYIKNYNELLRHHALALYHHWLSKCLKPSNTQLLFILNPLSFSIMCYTVIQETWHLIIIQFSSSKPNFL